MNKTALAGSPGTTFVPTYNTSNHYSEQDLEHEFGDRSGTRCSMVIADTSPLNYLIRIGLFSL
jgi:hypothetical protein